MKKGLYFTIQWFSTFFCLKFYLFICLFFNWAVRLCVRDDKYGWAVVEKSSNHCVVRWVLNSFDFYLLSYKIIDMYIQRLNFSYFECIYLLFRLVTKSSVNPIWRHFCLKQACAIPGRIGNSWGYDEDDVYCVGCI
jgi:hypothetical protein